MRQLSVHRRKPHLVDLLINKTPGAYSYKLKWATGFDSAAFTDFLTVPMTGYRDPAVSDAATVTLHGDRVRVLFDPSSYSIIDNSVWWLRMSPIDATGAEMFTTPPLMMYLPNLGGSYFPQFTITGSAPNALNLTGSIEIHFPHQMRDMRILSSAAMWVAFDSNGQEILLQGSSAPKDLNLWSTESVLFVRGNGAVVPFSLLFTLAYTR
jgi:hypothetical protein